jgi:polyphenol oxidase
LLQLRREAKKGTIECRFYGAERAGFGTHQVETYQEILENLKGGSAIRFVEQVHGDEVHLVTDAEQQVMSLGEGDALVTGLTGVALAIRTADCIPILIHSRTTGHIAAVHAGWRGLEAKILSKTVTKLCNLDGVSAATLCFDIGPFIAAESYEVGGEVAERFAPDCSRRRPNGKFSLELGRALSLELGLLNIGAQQIQWHAADTFNSPEWYSARRGDQLRNFTVIMRTKPESADLQA